MADEKILQDELMTDEELEQVAGGLYDWDCCIDKQKTEPTANQNGMRIFKVG